MSRWPPGLWVFAICFNCCKFLIAPTIVPQHQDSVLLNVTIKYNLELSPSPPSCLSLPPCCRCWCCFYCWVLKLVKFPQHSRISTCPQFVPSRLALNCAVQVRVFPLPRPPPFSSDRNCAVGNSMEYLSAAAAAVECLVCVCVWAI